MLTQILNCFVPILSEIKMDLTKISLATEIENTVNDRIMEIQVKNRRLITVVIY